MGIIEGITGPSEKYTPEEAKKRLLTKEQMDKIPEQKREKLLKQLDNYCGVSGENFDNKKCEKLIEETYKYSPEGKTKFDQGRLRFKTIEMQNIRQNQYNGGLLSDLSYRNKEDLNIETLQRKLQTLNTNDKNDEKTEIENAFYLINTLKQKGFLLETMQQRNLGNGFSAFYIENNKEEGFFVIRGTTDVWGKDFSDDKTIGISSQFSNRVYDTINFFNAIVPKDKKVIVYGHSLGGYLAQALVLKNYERIKEVITYDAPGLPQYDTKTEALISGTLQIKLHSFKKEIIQRLFTLSKKNYKITNVLTQYPIIHNRGQRIGYDIELPGVKKHGVSFINMRIARMNSFDLKKYNEKNLQINYEQEKEKHCNTAFDFDKERCQKGLEQMKESFKDNQKILKMLTESENYLEAMETKSELMTYAIATRIGNYDIPSLAKKHERFFKISTQEKFKYIVDCFFELQNKSTFNEEEIMALLDIYYLEKTGYPAQNIGDPKVVNDLKITVLKPKIGNINLVILDTSSLNTMVQIGMKHNVEDEGKIFDTIEMSLKQDAKNIILGAGLGAYFAQKLYLKKHSIGIEKVVTFKGLGVSQDDALEGAKKLGNDNRDIVISNIFQDTLLKNQKIGNVFHVLPKDLYGSNGEKMMGKRIGKDIVISGKGHSFVEVIENAPIEEFDGVKLTK